MMNPLAPAILTVTLNPAIQLHIADRVGSIETGKDADLDIYDQDPLSVYAVAQKVLIDGQVYFDRQQDIAVHKLHCRPVRLDASAGYYPSRRPR
jgi:imidazolonepropionase-like amidohydrolase